MTTIYQDGSGQFCGDHKNVRWTIRHPSSAKDWAGSGRYLSVRAYTDAGKLMMGADLPITSDLSDEEILGRLFPLLNEISP